MVEIEQPRVPRYTYNFQVLKLRHKAETDSLPESVPGREKARGQAPAQDGHVRMVPVVCPVEVPATDQADTERVEKAWRYGRRMRHQTGAWRGGFGSSRDRLLPSLLPTNRDIREPRDSTPGRVESRSMSCR